MKSKEKTNNGNIEKDGEQQKRRDLFTWVHRYLRLHNDLLADTVYQTMYDYSRNELISYLKTDVENNNFNDMQLGELVDALADVFNKEETICVNSYKKTVELLYECFKESTTILN